MTPRRLIPAVLLVAAPLAVLSLTELAGLWTAWLTWTIAWWWRGLPFMLRLAGVA